MNIKKLITFTILLIILLIILFLMIYFFTFTYKSLMTNKYIKMDEILTISNNKDTEIVFYNTNNKNIKTVYYNLCNSTNKVGQDILIREYRKDFDISLDNFKIILNKVSDLTNTHYKLDENNIIKYGGEQIVILPKELQLLLNFIEEL